MKPFFVKGFHMQENSSPKIFGYLYIAVFSNGTIKAGMSKTSPRERVNSHANAGRAFGIHMDAAFHASIYTNNLSHREKLMHKEIIKSAILTAGREWFKFDYVNDALNFASSYLSKIERMSFSERPSEEELSIAHPMQDLTLENINKLFEFPNKPVPAKIYDFDIGLGIDMLKPATAMYLASKVMQKEEYLTIASDDCHSGLPILWDVIGAHYDEYYKGFDVYSGAPWPAVHECVRLSSLPINETLNPSTAVKILKAAANYPEFFMMAVN